MPWLHVKPLPGPPTVEQVTRFGNGGAVRAAFIPPLPARKEGKIEILQTAERAEVVDASERSRVADSDAPAEPKWHGRRAHGRRRDAGVPALPRSGGSSHRPTRARVSLARRSTTTGRQLVACTTCLPAPGHPQPDRLWGVGHELAAFEEAHLIVTPNGSDVSE